VQGTTVVLDRALTREADGLLADMMADPDLPRHLLAGLKAVSGLLKSTDVPLIADSHRAVGARACTPGAGGSPVGAGLPPGDGASDYADLPYAERHVYLPKVTPVFILLTSTLG